MTAAERTRSLQDRVALVAGATGGAGRAMFRIGFDTHAITSHFALPLLIRHPDGLVVEMTDGTAEYNAAYRHHEGFYYDLVKVVVQRMTTAHAYELRPDQASVVAVTPGWMRSEDMLDFYGVTESTWRDATARVPHFCISESPAYTGRSRRSRPIRTWRAGQARWSPAASWHASTGSPTLTEPSQTAGVTWSKSRTRTFRRTIVAIASQVRPSAVLATCEVVRPSAVSRSTAWLDRGDPVAAAGEGAVLAARSGESAGQVAAPVLRFDDVVDGKLAGEAVNVYVRLLGVAELLSLKLSFLRVT